MSLVDETARVRALTALDETLLVEAAAGTGKTALMAGRAAMLLANGVEPGAIAAVTFTELAAGELALRIRGIVSELLASETPPPVLRPALPAGLSPAQRENLRAAAARLDDLTATTIHGFCQEMIRAYAVEADLDPGASVMDGPAADAMFDAAFSRWLRRRLSDDADPNAPIGVLAAEDPLQVVANLRELALRRRNRPGARPPPVDLSLRPDLDFREAVEEFAHWFARGPGEPRTADMLEEMGRLGDFFGEALAAPVSFEELWRLARPPRASFMKVKGLDWRPYTLKGAWRALGPGAAARFETAKAHYEACRSAFAALIGQLAGALIAEVAASLDELLDDYAAQKRAAAALDFDDLLLRARQLLRNHESVRRALGRRYRHIFVDEFQDTDPLQAEIIFGLASDAFPEAWIEAAPRPGSLFLVGDPKQAIYRFRGAHVTAYLEVRDALARRRTGAVVQITANFRSAPAILEHVNHAFKSPLDQDRQPGYVPLSPTRDDAPAGPPAVAKLTIELPPGSSAPEQRDEEANAVADLCLRLVGAANVPRTHGGSQPLRPGDIALLAPTGTELWRYERALEQRGLSVASQAGKTLMRRQETQDVLALLRTLADPLDRLAFGALMRGPLVGLTEARLLGVAGALPREADGSPGVFSMETSLADVIDPIARSVLEKLQALAILARTATPAALLTEAAERMQIRAALKLRDGKRSARSTANLDALIALARPYGVRGLAAFVATLSADWEARRQVGEGRIDESEDAVALVTIHSAKGLEWPVVIPINTATLLRGPEQFVHRQADNTLHWILGGLVPPQLADAQAEESTSAARERERLWYVAMTRACDLLVLPHLTAADQRSWSRILDLGAGRLPEFDPTIIEQSPQSPPAAAVNMQTPAIFAAEAAAVRAAAPPVIWRRPSEHDGDRATTSEVMEAAAGMLEVPTVVGAGRVRGVLLHKLMEEMVTGELLADAAATRSRATVLAEELQALAGEEEAYPDPEECAATALRARALPDVAARWSSLQAEVPIYAMDHDGTLISGRADAVALREGRIDVILDWKSDLAPSAAERSEYAAQVAAYMRVTGASRGALVYLSRDEVTWIDAAS
ncbi:UvrD-helicase domain-containing protein [Brevundimonas sp.]|uniref:UvrD-helicase domain-containing protein n=1 Tax=Brevundimonas sp. TaxID=1871086 RepID=UPI001ACCA443|nr:UvrD-helicase domain-containing protein [Brevundimonas sp.]MBN9466016.1 UvrD-helicase domain-containing protein [Brevundimonas sp.]